MNTTNEDMDRLVRRAVKMSPLEKPEKGFSHSVMSKIEGLAEEKVIIPERSPLISQTGWMIIVSLIVIAFSVLLISGPTKISLSYFDNYVSLFNSISLFNSVSLFSNINYSFPISVSNIFLTGLFAFVFFFIIEISIITRNIKKVNH